MGSLSSSNSTLLSMLMNSPKSLLSNYKLPQHQYSLSDSKRDIFVPLFTILTLQLTNKRRTAVGESHILSFGEVLSRCHAYAIGCRSVFREFLHRTYSSPEYFKKFFVRLKEGFRTLCMKTACPRPPKGESAQERLIFMEFHIPSSGL